MNIFDKKSIFCCPFIELFEKNLISENSILKIKIEENKKNIQKNQEIIKNIFIRYEIPNLMIFKKRFIESLYERCLWVKNFITYISNIKDSFKNERKSIFDYFYKPLNIGKTINISLVFKFLLKKYKFIKKIIKFNFNESSNLFFKIN